MAASRSWGDHELAVLETCFVSASIAQLRRMLPGRSWSTIYQKGRSLGLRRQLQADVWTAERLARLGEVYGCEPRAVILAEFPFAAWSAIRHQAALSGFRRRRFPELWTPARCDALAAIYVTAERSKIMAEFPFATWERIRAKALLLGLHRPKRRRCRRPPCRSNLGRAATPIERAIFVDPAFVAFNRAVPRYLQPADREDVLQDMMVAMLEGRLSPADASSASRHFVGRQMASFASQRSVGLDEAVFPGARRTLNETLAAPVPEPQDAEAAAWRERLEALAAHFRAAS